VGQVLGATTFNFTRTLFFGSRGDEVTELQKRLTQEGVYAGPITGYFGHLTVAALKAFQRKNGLDPVGVLGPKTRVLLNQGVVIAPPTSRAPSIASLEAQIQDLLAHVAHLQAELEAAKGTSH
jgi:N-acetylmuramoyl-L-alanine amidase